MRPPKWGLGLALAGLPLCAAGAGLDLVMGHPAEAVVMGACVAGNAVSARVLARNRHRPDYARIAELEQELGLTPRRPTLTPASGATPPLTLGQVWRPGNWNVPPDWARCPVCTRTHAGRCAG